MKQCIFTFIIVFLVLPSISLASESDTLFLDGVGIKIGAPKIEVRAKFPEGYTIAEQNENWAFSPRNASLAQYSSRMDTSGPSSKLERLPRQIWWA